MSLNVTQCKINITELFHLPITIFKTHGIFKKQTKTTEDKYVTENKKKLCYLPGLKSG